VLYEELSPVFHDTLLKEEEEEERELVLEKRNSF